MTRSPRKPAGLRLLGGITPKRFLADYWQKKPLLIRGALPGAEHLISREQLFELAQNEDMQSRFVSQAGGWNMRHGPFSQRDLKRAKGAWSILVQGVNLLLPAGDQLLRAFNFIPHARLDDLMVSYAADGGGVGPHFDNYDVFLLQGLGRRRWRISNQSDTSLIEDLPLRILKNFKPKFDWVLEPGDMLYLPPGWAHEGVAVGECITFSVGFRAPPAQELADQFLTFLQDNLCLTGRYQDPELSLQKHPGEISTAMIDKVGTMLAQIQWDQNLIRDFLGAMLTEPKPHVFFEPPNRPYSLNRFSQAAARQSLVLDLRSQLLFSGKYFYLNGEKLDVPASDTAIMRELADCRTIAPLLAPKALSQSILKTLHQAYCDGFIRLKK